MLHKNKNLCIRYKIPFIKFLVASLTKRVKVECTVKYSTLNTNTTVVNVLFKSTAGTHPLVLLKDGAELLGPGECGVVELHLLRGEGVHVQQVAQPFEGVLGGGELPHSDSLDPPLTPSPLTKVRV